MGSTVSPDFGMKLASYVVYHDTTSWVLLRCDANVLYRDSCLCLLSVSLRQIRYGEDTSSLKSEYQASVCLPYDADGAALQLLMRACAPKPQGQQGELRPRRSKQC